MPPTTQLFNAVFKGGGAKGLAYTGAVRACEEAGIQFLSVAGSSAGAITATLLASGHTSAEMEALVPSALATLEGATASLFRRTSGSLIDTRSLHRWLHAVLCTAMDRTTDEAAVTFVELCGRFKIELYVVAMDLSTRQPIVFSPLLTPDTPVADAVIASSAIPVAFPPARMVIDSEIHRVVDGGTWANYPAFIFLDQDFRSFHKLPESTSPTIGFILDSDDAPEPTRSRSIQPASGPEFPTDRGSILNELGPVGAVLSSPALRVVAAAVPALLLAITALLLIREGRDDFTVTSRIPDSLEGVAIMSVAALLAVGIPLSGLATFVVLRLGRSIADTGVVGALSAMGVGPSVPYWVRLQDPSHTHIPVRIRVPEALTTLAFAASQPVRDEATLVGYTETLSALRHARVYLPTAPPTELQSVPFVAARAIDPGAGDPCPPASPQPVAEPPDWFGIPRVAVWRAVGSQAILITAIGVATATLAMAAAAMLVGNPVLGLAAIVAAGVGLGALIACLGWRQSLSVADPFPIMRRLPNWLLLTGLLAAALLLTITLLGLSLALPSPVPVANADPVVGVMAQRSADDTKFAILIPTSSRDLASIEDLLPGSIDSDLRERFENQSSPVAEPTVDAAGRELEVCPGQVETGGVSCRMFPQKGADYEAGAAVPLHVDDTGVAFIGSAVFTVMGALALPAIAGIYCSYLLGFVYQGMRLRTWRRAVKAVMKDPETV